MPRLGYCDAGIEVDGNRLEEYGTQTDGKTVTTWVESEAGKVMYTLSEPLTRLLIDSNRTLSNLLSHFMRSI